MYVRTARRLIYELVLLAFKGECKGMLNDPMAVYTPFLMILTGMYSAIQKFGIDALGSLMMSS